ncbi:hypothetical protein BABINDRAFT_145758 [Babjeviella inositovora NRRL Y-12698]|uniref:C2H2-type domain-containing protein n=1 Tax=Babjeviella inositovora NRRL Y-12698 TaxID=984486 RepID=A0A1E3QPL8_9ASCO|nr:uncharacterized protein BABINDRAFT_145758 [Babjeviella inositovora NRRL Y-12698]ODQ79635.1 hypothetical protein BABINDRAFT_145758 [Babjeviella inositovora NRRL Y-12698]
MEPNPDQKVTVNSYGRTSWNKEAYAQEALSRRKPAIEADSEAKAEVNAGTVTSHQLMQLREQVLEQVNLINTTTIISNQIAASNSKRGKGVGFYCDVCDLTFKDDYQFITHLNHPAHLKNVGFDEDVESQKEVSLQEVKDRLAMLKRNLALKREADGKEFDLSDRIKKRREFDLKEEEKRRVRRRAVKLRKRAETASADSDIAQMMGFGGFLSTKT